MSNSFFGGGADNGKVKSHFDLVNGSRSFDLAKIGKGILLEIKNKPTEFLIFIKRSKIDQI